MRAKFSEQNFEQIDMVSYNSLEEKMRERLDLHIIVHLWNVEMKCV